MACLLSANFVTKALNSKENLKKSSSVICFIDFMFRVLSSHLLLQKKFFYKIAKNSFITSIKITLEKRIPVKF